MATLRDLRRNADELGIAYEKTTSKDDLEALIAAALAEQGDLGPVADPPFGEDGLPRGDREDSPTFPMDVADMTTDGELCINEHDLVREFREQASKYRRFAYLEARAQALVLESKYAIDQVEADRFLFHRKEFLASDTKPTEKLLDATIKTDSIYKAAVTRYIEAKEAADKLKGVCESFRQRRDMLVQIGSRQRQDMDAAITIRSAEMVGKMAAAA
jgi:hypothetical protein